MSAKSFTANRTQIKLNNYRRNNDQITRKKKLGGHLRRQDR